MHWWTEKTRIIRLRERWTYSSLGTADGCNALVFVLNPNHVEKAPIRLVQPDFPVLGLKRLPPVRERKGSPILERMRRFGDF